MSVRPISVGEETKAFGHPWVNIMSLFGASQGLLIYLHRHRIPFTSNWFATPGSKGVFAFLVVGGYLAGGAVAMAGFSDHTLARLANAHKQDLALLTDAQNARNFSQ